MVPGKANQRVVADRLDWVQWMLAKVFGEAVTEYKQIAEELERRRVLAPDSAHRLRVLAGCRNRMVHFYHDVTEKELYAICTEEIADVVAVRDAYVSWLKNHPECIDTAL